MGAYICYGIVWRWRRELITRYFRGSHGIPCRGKIRNKSVRNSVAYRTVGIQENCTTPFRAADTRYRPFRPVYGMTAVTDGDHVERIIFLRNEQRSVLYFES